MAKTKKKMRHSWKYPSSGLLTKAHPGVCSRCGWLIWVQRSKHKSPYYSGAGYVTMITAPGGTPLPYSEVSGCEGVARG